MRRRYSGSEDEDDRPVKRSREDMDVEKKLETLIKKVGSRSSTSVEANLEALACVLESDLPDHKEKITQFLCECIVEFPAKLTIYSTLVGLLNAKDYSCGGEFVEILLRKFKEALKASQYNDAEILLRFLADLVNCHTISASDILTLFDKLLEVTSDDCSPQVRSDWYVFAVLQTLPWVGRELYEKKNLELNKMLQFIQGYMKTRSRTHVEALRVWSTSDPHEQEDALDCLWAQIGNLKKANWVEKVIYRPYVALDGKLCEALQHSLPNFIAPPHGDGAQYPLPAVVFRMFDYTDVPEDAYLPGSHSIERFLIEEQLLRIIRNSGLERKDCACQLVGIEYDKVPKDFVIIEAVFGQLFRLPNPIYVDVMYASLIIELCKLRPSSMPVVLAQTTQMLFDRLDSMNTTCIERFASWLSLHLSNYQFRWSWKEWVEVVEMDRLSPKRTFVRELLLLCQRLSYNERICEEVSADMSPLFPVKPAPVNKYALEENEHLSGVEASKELESLIRKKASPDTISESLKRIGLAHGSGGSAMDDGEEVTNPLAINVFTQTLLNLAKKSPSHSFAAIAKFHDVFKSLAAAEEGQIEILKAMYEVWSSDQEMMKLLTNKMVRTGIVECSAVANWVFSHEMTKDFTCFYLWEILHSSIKTMNRHVTKLQADLEEAKEASQAGSYVPITTRPTDEEIDELEDTLESTRSKQKNLFLIIFQRFIILLSTHITNCENDGQDINTPWFKWAIERLQQVFVMHQNQVNKYVTTLESLLFTSDIDVNIFKVFQQFIALRA